MRLDNALCHAEIVFGINLEVRLYPEKVVPKRLHDGVPRGGNDMRRLALKKGLSLQVVRTVWDE